MIKQKITFLFFAVFTMVLTAQTVNIEGGSSYGTIQEAIDASVDGNIILIAGVHTETISISNKSITLRGTDPTTDIIEAAASALSDGTGSRVISMSASSTAPDPLPTLTITIENLGIRHGNTPGTDNGGGIHADKITGLLTLKNLIIEDNYSAKNGGGVSLAGTNANIIECTIKNNTSVLDGGGIITAPNNGVTVNNTINIEQSLINSNNGRNGGGIYINGNTGSGDNNLIAINLENSTISNNQATSGTSGAGGGSIWSKSATFQGTGGGTNVTLQVVHATFYNNSHAATTKQGMRFTGTSNTNFSAYNSIIVNADLIANRAINFLGANVTDLVNCVLGGLENAAPFLGIIDDVSKNNLKGKTATQAGLTGALTDEGGNTLVLPISSASTAENYCTVATGITIPTIDQRGYAREGVNDAGAFEVGGVVLGLSNVSIDSSLFKIYPNPSKDFIRVQGIDSIEEINIYSILGALEKTIYNNDHINISDLTSGVYIVVVKGDNKIGFNRLIVK